MNAWRSMRWPLLAAAVALRATAAEPPDWLAACLPEDISARNPRIAAIVLLDYEQVRYLSADRVIRVLRGAEKIVADQARAGARVRFPYNAGTDRVLTARAWVTSAHSGKTRSFSRDDFVDTVAQYSKYFWDLQRTIGFDGSDKVERGGVLAWEVEIESPSGVFASSHSFLMPKIVTHPVFEVIPMPGGRLEWHATSALLRSPVPGAEPGALRWELARLDPHPTGRPTGFLPNPLEVSVRCAAPDRPPAAAGTWEDQSRLAARIVEPAIEATGEVKAKAEALVAGKTGRWDRIRAVADFVQREIVYLSVSLDADYVAGYRPHPASSVLRNGYGDCKDKAALMVSMLRAVGEDARVVLLYAANPSVVDADWPALAFNHAIVAILEGAPAPARWPVSDGGPLGRIILFDPTDPVTPLGVLSGGDQGGSGLVLDQRQGLLIRLPTDGAARNRLDRSIRAEITPQGSLTAKVEEVRLGLFATETFRRRHEVGAAQFQRSLESLVHGAAPLERDVHWTDNWDPPACRYSLELDFTADRFAQPVGGDTLLIDPRVVPSAPPLERWRTEAEGTVWLPASDVREESRIALPRGCAVLELPDAWIRKEASVSGSLSYRTEGRDIVFLSEVTRRGGFYDSADYARLWAFYEKLHEAQRRPVVLRIGAIQAPNQAAH